jgi:hypothetical protein
MLQANALAQHALPEEDQDDTGEDQSL